MKWYERIKKRRIEMKYTQKELANILGYKSKSSINKIELGIVNVPQSKIIPIAKALDCSPVWLFGLTDDLNEELNQTITSPINNDIMNILNKLSEENKEKVLDYALLLLQSREEKQ
jgi:transcriptional regulator with XRE-family HTH domain